MNRAPRGEPRSEPVDGLPPRGNVVADAPAPAHRRVTPPFEGLLAALRLALNTGDREADGAALAAIGDWPAVAALLRGHRVASLVSLAVRGRARRAAGVAEGLSGLPRKRLVQRAFWQLAGLRQATDCLDEAGIPHLVLKGLPLSQRLFGTPLARDCNDIDLLIPPSAARDAESALAHGGWRLCKPAFPPTPARVRCYDRYVKDRLFVGPGGPLELHHRLTDNPHLLPADFDSLCAHAATVAIGDRRFAVLGDDDLLVYLCVHGQLHRWGRLKWLCDAAALLASTGAARYRAAAERCRRLNPRLEPTLRTALVLCREHLGVDTRAMEGQSAGAVPVARDARRARRLWNSPDGGGGLRGVARRIDEARLVGAMGRWRGLAHELERFFVAPYDFGRIDLPDRLFFLYVPLSPILRLAGRAQRAPHRKRA